VKVLVVGSGGREHALAWGISRSATLDELHAAPGNPGIARLGQCHPVRAEDADGLLELARALEVGLVVIGPEAPLVAGVADHLRHNGVTVFGPSAAAARIEGSKAFAKDVLRAAGVPTATTLPVAKPPCVVKADGLAAGKGVFVCRGQAELDAALQAVSGPLILEELLEGDEASLLAVCDGRAAVPLPTARDYKRAGDGDVGPNTGGMGAFSPVPELEGQVPELVAAVHEPVLEELRARGSPFAGTLYAGLMLTADGPRVLEFNCRFGDPETQAIVPRLESDVLALLAAAAAGHVSSAEVAVSDDAAVCIVLAAGGYPAEGDRGTPIEGVEDAEAAGALVFHAGTARRGETLVTNGGRILNVVARGPTVAEARERAYAAVERISFAGARYRRDIGGFVHA
jgi:phosphoribosylamine--glycine ligase